MLPSTHDRTTRWNHSHSNWNMRSTFPCRYLYGLVVYSTHETRYCRSKTKSSES